jgi:hypothetical protein
MNKRLRFEPRKHVTYYVTFPSGQVPGKCHLIGDMFWRVCR